MNVQTVDTRLSLSLATKSKANIWFVWEVCKYCLSAMYVVYIFQFDAQMKVAKLIVHTIASCSMYIA